MTRLNPHRRLNSETIDARLPIGDSFHDVKITLAFDGDTDRLREIAFVGRGKSGHGLDDMLTELGIVLSRAIQNRDPHTGDPA